MLGALQTGARIQDQVDRKYCIARHKLRPMLDFRIQQRSFDFRYMASSIAVFTRAK